LNSIVTRAGDLTIAGPITPGGGMSLFGEKLSFSNLSNIFWR